MSRSEISPGAIANVVNSDKLRVTVPVRAYAASTIVAESTRRVLADAQVWLLGQRDETA